MSPSCRIGPVEFGAGRLALIAGPCMAESLELCLQVAGRVREICRKLDVGYVFKASYDKANRSSLASKRGPGLQRGLRWLAEVREKLGVPVLADVHEPGQVAPAAKVLDAVQIPAFLCRQTDLLVEAGRCGKPVNIKKGQFMAPWEMAEAVAKVRSAGNEQVLLTERGTFFGYNRLVSDLRSIPQMRRLAPVVFDATHSVQEPGAMGSASGGQRQYVPVLAAAAVAAGADALFVETHTDPDRALSDAACQMPLAEMEDLLARCLRIYRAARS
ncbi:MAG TPA: 3-deoxy-8-phosphooctulonate synthase [Phycisphaerae bacterium]|nr:3-deoxy-8-phosphooctulonate synthase [Phycisphaerae bacterium]HUT57902.1 3-deoxy-8-phosphooctulonate synthase [Phycisphaerae bacterium]